MTLSKISLIISSLFVAGCAGIPRPVGHICGIDGQRAKLSCYDLIEDFDSNGKMKPSAKPVKTAITLRDLHGGTYFDPDTTAELKIYIGRVRDALNSCQGKQQP